jgi:hypothetical protein
MLPDGRIMGRRKIDPNTSERRCRLCNQVKPLKDFYPHRGMPLGRSYTCIKCDKADHTRRDIGKRDPLDLIEEIKRDERLLEIKRAAIKRGGDEIAQRIISGRN